MNTEIRHQWELSVQEHKSAVREEACSSCKELQQELTSCCEAHHGDLKGQAACFHSLHLSILIYTSCFLMVFFVSIYLFLSVLTLQHPFHLRRHPQMQGCGNL